MTTIRVKDNEPYEVALRRFKRTIEKLGLLTDLRAREFFEKPTTERKRKKSAAVKRNYKRIRSMQVRDNAENFHLGELRNARRARTVSPTPSIVSPGRGF